MGEVEVRVERRAAPNAPRLDTPVIGRRDLDEVGRLALLEQQGDIALQLRLVALDREMVMRLTHDQVAGQSALGQQGIGRDILALELTAFEQGDGHADFVGAFAFLIARYGQGADFFWARQVFESWPTTLRMCVCCPASSRAFFIVLPSIARASSGAAQA